MSKNKYKVLRSSGKKLRQKQCVNASGKRDISTSQYFVREITTNKAWMVFTEQKPRFIVEDEFNVRYQK